MPWVTSDLKSLFNKQDGAFKRYKQTKNDHHKAKYLQLWHEAQKQEHRAYKHYTDSIFDQNREKTLAACHHFVRTVQ